MQISTNWSVSHLRHWRPPVASSGYYLYRYTGRSWFKSKQSALRSILPNANIHHNEKRPGRGQGQTPGVHIGVCFSPWGGGQVNTSLPLLGSVKQHTPNRTKKISYMGLQCESVDDGWVFPCKKTGSQTKSRGKPNAHCDDRKKSLWYIRRWWTAKVGVPVKCRELGRLWWVGKEMVVG